MLCQESGSLLGSYPIKNVSQVARSPGKTAGAMAQKCTFHKPALPLERTLGYTETKEPFFSPNLLIVAAPAKRRFSLSFHLPSTHTRASGILQTPVSTREGKRAQDREFDILLLL